MEGELEFRCVRVADLIPDDAAFAAVYARLPAWRRKACDALRFPSDRRRSAAAWMALRGLLAARGIDADALGVAFGETGKPRFEPSVGVHFSISHSGGRVMAAVSDGPVGCDVERIAPTDPDVVRAALSPREFAAVARIPGGTERDRGFCRLWVRKESYLKALGSGVGGGLAAVPVLEGETPPEWALRDWSTDDGYCAAVCFLRKTAATP